MTEMELTDEIAPPMANGEVIFEAPWQSRTFGLARVLCEAGHFEWDEFREELIQSIERWESSADNQEAYEYFDCFLEALTQLLAKTDLCSAEQIDARTEAFEARPHGHDHHHH